MTTFDLLLVGFGNVARRFVSLLAEHRAALARDFGVTTRVVGIATRRHGHAYAAAGLPSYVVSGFPPPLRLSSAELRRDLAEARSAKAGNRTHTGTNGPPKELVNKSLSGGARAFQASDAARLKASPSFDRLGPP